MASNIFNSGWNHVKGIVGYGQDTKKSYPDGLFQDEQRQMQQSVQIHKDRQDQRLVTRVKFMKLTRNVIRSVELYGKAVMDGKSPDTLETMNDGVNLQMLFLKADVKDKLELGSEYDLKTIRLGQALANEFKERVVSAKEHPGQSKRVKSAIKMMEIYAGAIDQTMEDPESVADPREVKYNGPSGAELDRQIRKRSKRGEKSDNGCSSLMAAQHRVGDLVKDVRKNPEKYQREHERMLRESERNHRPKGNCCGHIPADDFNFHIRRENLEPASHDRAPILDGTHDEKESQDESKRIIADRELFFMLVRKTIEMARLYADACREDGPDESVLGALNDSVNLHLSLVGKSAQVKLKSTKQYDRDTVSMALFFAGQFTREVQVSARSEAAEQGGSISVATERLIFYADAIETVLSDPLKVGLVDVFEEIRRNTMKKVNENMGQVVREHKMAHTNQYKSKKILKEIPDDAFHFRVHVPDSHMDVKMAGVSEHD